MTRTTLILVMAATLATLFTTFSLINLEAVRADDDDDDNGHDDDNRASIKHVTLEDGECIFDENLGFHVGWCPTDVLTTQIIMDPDVTANSVISATVTFATDRMDFEGWSCEPIRSIIENHFDVACPVMFDGSILNYVVINP